jgi:hypothetical protein
MSKATAMNAEDNKWQTEEDARTLERAAEVKASPSRLKRVLAMLKNNEEKSGKARMDVARILRMKNRKE